MSTCMAERLESAANHLRAAIEGEATDAITGDMERVDLMRAAADHIRDLQTLLEDALEGPRAWDDDCTDTLRETEGLHSDLWDKLVPELRYIAKRMDDYPLRSKRRLIWLSNHTATLREAANSVERLRVEVVRLRRINNRSIFLDRPAMRPPSGNPPVMSWPKVKYRPAWKAFLVRLWRRVTWR